MTSQVLSWSFCVGTWCNVGGTDRCMFCGVDSPLPRQTAPSGAKLNWAADEDFAGFNRSLVAETCAEPYVERLGLSGLDVVRSYPPNTRLPSRPPFHPTHLLYLFHRPPLLPVWLQPLLACCHHLHVIWILVLRT